MKKTTFSTEPPESYDNIPIVPRDYDSDGGYYDDNSSKNGPQKISKKNAKKSINKNTIKKKPQQHQHQHLNNPPNTNHTTSDDDFMTSDSDLDGYTNTRSVYLQKTAQSDDDVDNDHQNDQNLDNLDDLDNANDRSTNFTPKNDHNPPRNISNNIPSRHNALSRTISIPPTTHEELHQLPADFYSKYYNCETKSDRNYSDYLDSYVNHIQTCTTTTCIPYHIDILRNLSLRGYLNPYHRRRIWPLLLGVFEDDIDLNYTRFLAQNHPQYDQLNKDILRSCHHLDIHVGNNEEVVGNNRVYLGRILHSLFSKYDQALISYCQGFHDIALICLIICGVPPSSSLLFDAVEQIGSDLTGRNNDIFGMGKHLFPYFDQKNGKNNNNNNDKNNDENNSQNLSTQTTHSNLSNLSLPSSRHATSSYLSRNSTDGSVLSSKNGSKNDSKNDSKNSSKYSTNLSNQAATRQYSQTVNKAIKLATEKTLDNVKTNSNDALAFAIIEKLALTSISQTLKTSLFSVQNLISLVPTILHPFVPQFSSILSQMPLIYSLSWFLTWFSHSNMNFLVISRMFDFLLASNPLMCVQVSSAVLITHAPRIKAQIQLAAKERIEMGMDFEGENGSSEENEQKDLKSDQSNDFVVNEMDMISVIQYFQQTQVILDIDAIVHIATSLWALSSQRLLHIESSLTKSISDEPNFLFFAQNTGDYFFSLQNQAEKDKNVQKNDQIYNRFNLNPSYLSQKQSYPLDLSFIGLLKLPKIFLNWLSRPRLVNIVSLRLVLDHLLLANGISSKQLVLPEHKPISMHSQGSSGSFGDENGQNGQTGQTGQNIGKDTKLITDIISLCKDLNEISNITIDCNQIDKNSSKTETVSKCNVSSILTKDSPLLITHSFIYYAFRPSDVALYPGFYGNDQNEDKIAIKSHPQAGGKLNNAIQVWRNEFGKPVLHLGGCAVKLPTISVKKTVRKLPKLLLDQIVLNNPYSNGNGMNAASVGNRNGNNKIGQNGQNDEKSNENEEKRQENDQNDEKINNQQNDDEYIEITMQTDPMVLAACVNLQYIMEPPAIIKDTHAEQQEDIFFNTFGGKGILKNKSFYSNLREEKTIQTNQKEELTKLNATKNDSNQIDYPDIDVKDQSYSVTEKLAITDLGDRLNDKLKQRKLFGKKERNINQNNENNNNEKNNKKSVTFAAEKIDDQNDQNDPSYIKQVDSDNVSDSDSDSDLGSEKVQISSKNDKSDQNNLKLLQNTIQSPYDLPSNSDDDLEFKLARKKHKEHQHEKMVAARKKLIDHKLELNKRLFEEKIHLDGLLMTQQYGKTGDNGGVGDDLGNGDGFEIKNGGDIKAGSDGNGGKNKQSEQNKKVKSISDISPIDLIESAKKNIEKNKNNGLLPHERGPELSKHVQILIIDGQTKLIHLSSNGIESKAVFSLGQQQQQQQHVYDGDCDVNVTTSTPDMIIDQDEDEDDDGVFIDSTDEEHGTEKNIKSLTIKNTQKNKNLSQNDQKNSIHISTTNKILSADLTDPNYDYLVDSYIDESNRFELHQDEEFKALEAEEKIKNELFGPLNDTEILLLSSFKSRYGNSIQVDDAQNDDQNDAQNGKKNTIFDHIDSIKNDNDISNPNIHLTSLRKLTTDPDTITHADLITFNTARAKNIKKLNLRTKNGQNVQIDPRKIPYSHGLKQFIIDPLRYEQLMIDNPGSIYGLPVNVYLEMKMKQQNMEKNFKDKLIFEQKQFAIWRVAEEKQQQEMLLLQQLKSEQQKLMLLDVKQRELMIEMGRLVEGGDGEGGNQHDENNEKIDEKKSNLTKRQKKQQKQLLLAQQRQQEDIKEQHQQRILYLQQEQQRLELYQQGEISRILNISTPLFNKEKVQNVGEEHVDEENVNEKNNVENIVPQKTVYLEELDVVPRSKPLKARLLADNASTNLQISTGTGSLSSDTIMKGSALTPLPIAIDKKKSLNSQFEKSQNKNNIQNSFPNVSAINDGNNLATLITSGSTPRSTHTLEHHEKFIENKENDQSMIEELNDHVEQNESENDNDDNEQNEKSEEFLKNLQNHLDNIYPLTPSEYLHTPHINHNDTSTATMAIAQRLGLPPPNNTNRLSILRAKLEATKKKEDEKRKKSYFFNIINDSFNENLNSITYKDRNNGLFENYNISEQYDDTKFNPNDGIEKNSNFFDKIKHFMVNTIGNYLANPLDIFSSDSDLEEWDMDSSFGSKDERGMVYIHNNGANVIKSPYNQQYGPGTQNNERKNKSKKFSSRSYSVYNDDDYMYTDVSIRKRIRNERKAILFEKEQLQLLKNNLPYLPHTHQQQQYKAILLNSQLLRLGYPIIQPHNIEQQESFYWGKLVPHSDPIIIKRLNQFSQKSQRLHYASDKLSDYLLLVLDSLNITQIQPVMHQLNDETEQLYGIRTHEDAQKRYLIDCDRAKVMVLQLILELGWVLTREDFEWLEIERENIKNSSEGDDPNQNNQNLQNLQKNSTNPNSPHSNPTTSFPTLSTTLQIQQASQVPLFAEVRTFLIEKLTSDQQKRKLEYQQTKLGLLTDIPGSENYYNRSLLDNDPNFNVDFNMLTDSELRSVIQQQQFRIKIVDVFQQNSPSLPRLPRYSIEWVEYQRQVQERILLQRKEWILMGYSERKIKRLTKIAKRKLIYGNLTNNDNFSDDFKGLFGGDAIQTYNTNDKNSQSFQNDEKLKKKLKKLHSQHRVGSDYNPEEDKDNVLFSWGSSSDDEDGFEEYFKTTQGKNYQAYQNLKKNQKNLRNSRQITEFYHPTDIKSRNNQRELFENSKVSQLSLHKSPLDQQIRKNGSNLYKNYLTTKQGQNNQNNQNNRNLYPNPLEYYYAPDTFGQIRVDWDKGVNAMSSYQNSVDLQLFRFRLTKEQKKQDQMIRRAELLSSSTDSYTTDTSSDDDDFEDNDGIIGQGKDERNKLLKNKKKSKTIVDDVSKILNQQRKLAYKRYREERKLKMIRKQYRHELRQKRREEKNKEKIAKLHNLQNSQKDGNSFQSIYSMFTSSTSSDYSSTSGADSSDFDGINNNNDNNFKTLNKKLVSKFDQNEYQNSIFSSSSSSTDSDLEENEQVSILREMNELISESDQDGSNFNQNGDKHGGKIDPKYKNSKESTSKLGYSKFVKRSRNKSLLNDYNDDNDDKNINNNDNIDPLKHQYQKKQLTKLEEKNLLLIERRHQRLARERTYILSKPLDPISVLTTGIDGGPKQLVKQNNDKNIGLGLLLKICSFPFSVFTTTHQERITKDTVLPSLSNTQNDRNVVKHFGLTCVSDDLIVGDMTQNDANNSIMSGLNGVGNVKAYGKYGKKSEFKKGKNISMENNNNFNEKMNKKLFFEQNENIFIPTIFDYYTHIKRISHLHSCTCPYQLDMLNTRKSILFYQKFMTAQLLVSIIVSSSISSIYRLLTYFFPRLQGRLQWWNALTITMLSDIYTLTCNTSKYVNQIVHFEHTKSGQNNHNNNNNNLILNKNNEIKKVVQYDWKEHQNGHPNGMKPRLAIRYPLPPSVLWVPSAAHFFLLHEYRVFSLWVDDKNGGNNNNDNDDNNNNSNNNNQFDQNLQNNLIHNPPGNKPSQLVHYSDEISNNPNGIHHYTHILGYPDHCCDCPPHLINNVDDGNTEKEKTAIELCSHQKQRLLQKKHQLSLYNKTNNGTYASLYELESNNCPNKDNNNQNNTNTNLNYPKTPHQAQEFWQTIDQNEKNTKNNPHFEQNNSLTAQDLLLATNTPPLCVCETTSFSNYFITPQEHSSVFKSQILATNTQKHDTQNDLTSASAVLPNTNTLDATAITPPGQYNLPSSPSHIISHAIYNLLPQSPGVIIWGSIGMAVVITGVVEFFRR